MSWGVVSLEHAHATLRAMLAGDGSGCFECRWWSDGAVQRHFVPVCDTRRFGLVRRLGEDREVELFVVPRVRRGMAYAGQGSALWVRVEGRKQWEALRGFRPAPTIVLREGATTRATALWALDRPLGQDWLRRGCDRLSYALRAARKHGDPDGFTVNPPGSCLRDGRLHPVPIVVAACTDAIYTPRQVVGRLKEAPSPDAWRERMAA